MPVVNFERPVRNEPPVSLRIERETLRELDAIARHSGQCSRAAVLRRAISEFIAANRAHLVTEGNHAN